MDIRQFEDKQLAHYSYAIESEGKVAVIDPSRNPQPYYDYAKSRNANIVAVIETHPHADFVSSHLEISKTTGAKIYVSKLLGAAYPHKPFDEGDTIAIGKVSLSAMNTPGHSADSISIVMESEGEDVAVFTGDTLFIGDCGRPDLRENAGNIRQKREDQARHLYHSLKKLAALGNTVAVYPAHGKGSLCGKGMSSASTSTIGNERKSNWALQPMSEKDFVEALLEGQPFIPRYFVYDVELNRKGADPYLPGIEKVKIFSEEPDIHDAIVVDTRPKDVFLENHRKGAINLQATRQFETWLGSLITPGEKFYLVAGDEEHLKDVIARTAKIGYEKFVAGAFVFRNGNSSHDHIDMEHFRNNSDEYTIVDIRNHDESKEKIFPESIHIPLNELPERTNEIPIHKNIVVHCAGGYRSAAGASLIRRHLNGDVAVYDLGEHVKSFQE